MLRYSHTLVGLATLALLTGCGAFDTKKEKLSGERISVLALEKQLEPDPELAGLAITLPHPEAVTDWPEPGGNAAHSVGHPDLPDQLKVAWRVGIGDGSSRYGRILSPPVVAGGVVFAMDAQRTVSAYKVADGSMLWSFDVGPPDDETRGWGGGVAFDDGRLFITTGFGQVIALDPVAGTEIWRVSLGTPMRTAPTASGGRVFVINVDNELQALDAKDGHRLWTLEGVPQSAELAGGSSPAVADGVIVVPFSSGELIAARVENGRSLWTESLATTRRFDAISTLADIRGRPVIDRGRVYAVSHSGRMAAIDLRTGERVWEQDIGGMSEPWVAGDFIYVLSTSGELVCLTRADGRVRWLLQLDQYEDPESKDGPITWAGPLLAGDRLIMVSSEGEAWSISPYTGKPLGRVELPAGSFLPPVVAGNSLYLMTNDADLMALR